MPEPSYYDRRHGTTYELEPRRSRLTGSELAAQAQVDIDGLTGTGTAARAELETLLGS